ncbi:hypothetical protein J2Y69_001591 [Microbacterium resistens]|uniref:Sap, sulfolipid-1-addressing protein n=1 Tax=Microbacterium resistens TaxID=156977 RepID=A0ABU1SDL8_9MICO|nr:GAP family protein [Microbacterium resistens]MDR6866992.1 hypothetical protein [Microbacterium resistens]
MEIASGAPLALTLAVLALLDGLSVGTLLIPVFLLLSPGRVRAGRILLYLSAITVFYLLVGLLFLWGLVNIVDVAADFLSSEAGLIARLVIGAAMLVGSFLIPGSKKDAAPVGAPVTTSVAAAAETAHPAHVSSMESGPGLTPPDPIPARPAAATPRPGRLMRWRTKLLDPATPPIVVIGLAIAAGLVEVATMLPYIVAMTMLADAGVGTPLRIGALAGYCLLMIAPALLLLVLRVVAARAVEGPLQRLADWLGRTGSETTAWIIGIVGFLIARGAASELGLFSGLGSIFSGLGGS